MTAQMAQRSSRCRSVSGPGAGSCCWTDWIDGAACAAIAWKWPNESANWTASANSATRAPSPMFARTHFIVTTRPLSEAATPRCLRRYNITSQVLCLCVNRLRRETIREFERCESARWSFRNQARSTSFAQPGRGEGTEQQQQADQTGEDRQDADAPDHAGIAHFHAHPAVAAENA